LRSVSSTAEDSQVKLLRARITFAPRLKTPRNRCSHKRAQQKSKPAHKIRAPKANASRPKKPDHDWPQKIPPQTSHREVFRHASSGPTPVRNSNSNPSGIFTLLKNGALR